MAFGLFKKRGKAPPADPLAAYDALVEDLERQGTEIRRSAATLLAMRGELQRTIDRQRRQLEEIAQRQAEASGKRDGRAGRTLERDRLHARQQLEAAEAALAKASTDAQLLLELAEELAVELSELKVERTSAKLRLAAGEVVSAAMRQRTAEIQKVLALDAARDEIERAHALAEIYREEKARGG